MGHPIVCHYCGRKDYEVHECRIKAREEGETTLDGDHSDRECHYQVALVAQLPRNADIDSDAESEYDSKAESTNEIPQQLQHAVETLQQYGDNDGD